MCGRYLISEESEQIQQIVVRIDKSNPFLQQLKFGEIFPSNFVPVIFHNNNYSISKWGFSLNKKGLIINARGETILEKAIFKKHAMNERCLIPANGFFEWKKNINSKEKILFAPSNKFFYFAGISKSTQEGLSHFVILTTSPNSEVKEVHDRMPVILDKETATKWLKPVATQSEFISNLAPIIKPFEGDLGTGGRLSYI
jgi:putative SOS response-associated peptidase YedK